MLKFLFASALVTVTLAGCGATHVASPAASLVRSVQGNQVAGADTAVAERAIRASIERRIPDYFVSLHTLVVTPPAAGAVYGFTAEEEVSGLGGSKRFSLKGSFDQNAGALKILHRASL